ncbi:DUF411 domain-containing protein [Paracoccus methylarcula]|uniref:Metal-binding protein n=1 Tax=Paracoccus methylarcula TaxID=72022 RepID=A0A3R7NCK8_9RHOB|nr:DUF411 domain-containing protein [Paracoccus methylarcula]RNF34987.1 metal-binding protein [Paracoccus methylarcula]
MKRRTIIASFATVAIGGTFAFTSLSGAQTGSKTITKAQTGEMSKDITIWRDPGCGCCDSYADYLETNGYNVTRIDDVNFDKRSIEAGVPAQGLGCHLAKIDGYYVSGLVPADIIERLLTDRPDVTGITLPGMPANAPGMAREKTGTLKTYAFGEGGVSVYADE